MSTQSTTTTSTTIYEEVQRVSLISFWWNEIRNMFTTPERRLDSYYNAMLTQGYAFQRFADDISKFTNVDLNDQQIVDRCAQYFQDIGKAFLDCAFGLHKIIELNQSVTSLKEKYNDNATSPTIKPILQQLIDVRIATRDRHVFVWKHFYPQLQCIFSMPSSMESFLFNPEESVPIGEPERRLSCDELPETSLLLPTEEENSEHFQLSL